MTPGLLRRAPAAVRRGLDPPPVERRDPAPVHRRDVREDEGGQLAAQHLAGRHRRRGGPGARLAEGLPAGAGLDVFENEPGVTAALLASDRVVLTPHVGSATHETRRGDGTDGRRGRAGACSRARSRCAPSRRSPPASGWGAELARRTPGRSPDTPGRAASGEAPAADGEERERAPPGYPRPLGPHRPESPSREKSSPVERFSAAA